MRKVTEIYTELSQFYAIVSPMMGAYALGARILYSPPILKARVMFVGEQPGGINSELDTTWPTRNDYADATWHLAKTLQGMVDPKILRNHTVGTNANFFRARNAKEYEKNVDKMLQEKIKEFCLPRVIRLLNELDPQTVFCIGFKAFYAMRPDNQKIEEMRHNKKDVLVRSGEIAGRPVLAVPHLTGSRISTVDKDSIRERLRALLN